MFKRAYTDGIGYWLIALLFCGVDFVVRQVAGAGDPRVIQISVDGLRGDLLQNMVRDEPASFPNFYRLQTQGAYTFNARCDFANSTTIPNHISMITGRPVTQPEGQPATVHHGFANNFPGLTDTIHAQGNTNLDYVASVFDVVHDSGLSTAFYFGKSRLRVIQRSYDLTNGAPDSVGLDNGRNKIDTAVLNDSTFGLVSTLVDQLTNAPPHYTFLHLVDPDVLGHNDGWGSAPWRQGIVSVDGYLGQIFQAIDSNSNLLGQTVIILSADHGGGGEGFYSHGDPGLSENYTIPFFLWGANIPSGINLYHLMADRYDPGTSRPDYNYPRQPIRNGDGANLALSLLGLESVPGSWIHSDLSVEPPLYLRWLRNGPRLVLHWKAANEGLTLEKATDLDPANWQAITDGIENQGGTNLLTVDLQETSTGHYYRLRQE